MAGRLVILLVAAFALAIFAQTPQAQSQTSLGTVTNIGNAETCPSGRGFLTTVPETCYPATLSGCTEGTGDADMQFVYGVAAPSGTSHGTIVFFAGDGGIAATDGINEQTLLARYVTEGGYQVVQIAWGPNVGGQDGEETHIANAPSILTGACRPASFLFGRWERHLGQARRYVRGRTQCRVRCARVCARMV
jgi:hypothetical protein